MIIIDNYDELMKVFSDSKKVLCVLGSTYCVQCKMLEQLVNTNANKLEKNKISYCKVNLDEFDSIQKLSNIVGDVSSVPVTMIMVDGKMIELIDSVKNIDTYIKAFKEK